ncbi:peptidase inhibitor family I36 protein [Actinoallomurus sp. CA-150999]|uniref:peptidase inhibitor family I36 protein n=1 Tax=Actinoallomurus sp. CA-150999 TaxID=3239887 RepID=UPI003D924452
MNRIVRRVSMTMAGAVVAAGVTVPASAAHADPPLPCPRVFGVLCAFSGPEGHGELILLHHEEPFLAPPARSAQNQSPFSWCLYRHPEFQGEHREIARGQSIGDLGFHVRSAQPRPCPA